MLSVNDLVVATGGYIINGKSDIKIKKYSIDSREVDSDTWFIPIVGEKVDAHNFILDCVKCGIIGTFINKSVKNKNELIKEIIKINENVCIIEVNDTVEALKKCGIYNRNKHTDVEIVGITGSVGKTSTREMIATILSEKFNVLKTIKNYNSGIGLPLMLLMIEDQDICVLEMGMDGLRTIKSAKPNDKA